MRPNQSDETLPVTWGEAVAEIVDGIAATRAADATATRAKLEGRPWRVYSRAHLLDALHDRLALHDTDQVEAQIARFARMGRWAALKARWHWWRKTRKERGADRPIATQAEELHWLLTRTRRNERGLRTANLAVEELARFAALGELGHRAEYLSADETTDAYTVLATALREYCTSWAAFAHDYSVGLWARRAQLDRGLEREQDERLAATTQALMNDGGAWSGIAWNITLPPSTGRFFDALAEPGGAERHWRGPRGGWQQRINDELAARGATPRGLPAPPS